MGGKAIETVQWGKYAHICLDVWLHAHSLRKPRDQARAAASMGLSPALLFAALTRASRVGLSVRRSLARAQMAFKSEQIHFKKSFPVRLISIDYDQGMIM